MNSWTNKDTEIYCSFAKTAGNTGCRMMNTAFYYYGLNKIYKSFSVVSIEDAIISAKTLNIKGFAITMPYKVEVLKYVSDVSPAVAVIEAANTILNNNGHLRAYNTDAHAALTFLGRYNKQKKLYIVGGGGYYRAVKWAALSHGFDIEQITRDNWSDIKNIKFSIIYNCTPVNIEPMIDKSNEFINCLVESETGEKLAALQASKQFELYTNLEWPL